MGLDSVIRDPLSKRGANVDIFGAVRTRDTGLPPFGNTVQAIPFSMFFADGDGNTDMRVAGSVAGPLDFDIVADSNRDRYIKTVQFTIVDQNATLTQFGNIGDLNDPILFEWDKAGETVLLASMISNYDHVRLAGGQPAFGTGTAAFLAQNVLGNSEAYLPMVDFQLIFGLPWGIRLAAGSDETLRIIIQDDLTGVDGYDALARGFEIEPEIAQQGLRM